VVLTGLMGPAIFPCLLYTGLRTTTVANTSIIQALVPAMVTLIAWGLLRERLSRLQAAGIAISTIGVAVIVSRGNPLALGSVNFVPGDLIVLLAFVCWALYTVILRLKPREMHANTLLAATMCVGALATMPLWIWEAAKGEVIPMTPDALWAIAYIVLFPTLIAYYFYNHAIAIVGPTKAGLASHLVPPLGILLGVIFLGEDLEPYHFVSFAVILSGVVLVIRGGRAASKR